MHEVTILTRNEAITPMQWLHRWPGFGNGDVMHEYLREGTRLVFTQNKYY